MAATPCDMDPRAVYERLKDEPQGLPWPRRRELAQGLRALLEEQEPSEALLGLVRLLAEDPKGEVRADIAELLVLLPEREFVRLAAKLSQDHHAFVRRAAERALTRRRRGQDEERRRRRGQDQVQDLYEELERRYGLEAAQKAWAIAERLYDVNVGATVHNLRGLVTPVKADVAMLCKRVQKRQYDRRVFQERLGRMRERVEWVERMLQGMRDFSRVPVQDRRTERVEGLVREALGMARSALKAEGRQPRVVRVKTDIASGLTVRAAREALILAFSNLLKNALEAFPTTGEGAPRAHLEVRARQAGDGRIEVQIADNAAGMSAEDLEEILAFSPGRKTLKRYGTGFGLPVARRYIAAHGGSLAIESKAGKGTTVTVTLPGDEGGPEE